MNPLPRFFRPRNVFVASVLLATLCAIALVFPGGAERGRPEAGDLAGVWLPDGNSAKTMPGAILTLAPDGSYTTSGHATQIIQPRNSATSGSGRWRIFEAGQQWGRTYWKVSFPSPSDRTNAPKSLLLDSFRGPVLVFESSDDSIEKYFVRQLVPWEVALRIAKCLLIAYGLLRLGLSLTKQSTKEDSSPLKDSSTGFKFLDFLIVVLASFWVGGFFFIPSLLAILGLYYLTPPEPSVIVLLLLLAIAGEILKFRASRAGLTQPSALR